MKSWFSQRGYPQKRIETETSKVKFSGQRVLHWTKVEKGFPLVVTYHTLLKTTRKIIHDNLYLLYMNEELKHLSPMVSFRRVVLPVRLQEKLTKLIINLTAWRNA